MERMTRQRKAILKYLTQAERPLSVEEVLSEAAKEIPDISLSTIYRNLKKLVQDHKIAFVELPGENVRYEVVKHRHHHYFLCNQCNKLFVIPGCPKGLLEIIPKGFKLSGHSITLNGLCAECA